MPCGDKICLQSLECVAREQAELDHLVAQSVRVGGEALRVFAQHRFEHVEPVLLHEIHVVQGNRQLLAHVLRRLGVGSARAVA